MIYLDNAATTFPKSEAVYREMDRVNRTLAVNSGRGAYKVAKEAADIIASTKKRLLKMFNAEGYYDVVFTPSVTHALNQVIGGFDVTSSTNMYCSPYEHNAVARTLHHRLFEAGTDEILLPLKKNLEVDLDKTEFLFSTKSPDAVFATAVSNVTGYVLPVTEITDMVHRYGGIVVIDAAQAAGLVPMDLWKTPADIVCFAGHKTLCGPFGIGGFLIRRGTKLDPCFFGGTGSDSLNLDMPKEAPGMYEASSPNITAIAGLNAALTEMDVESHYKQVMELTEYAYEKLAVVPSIRMKGQIKGADQIGILSFVVDGYRSDEVGAILDDEFDIAVRTGYHCAPYIHDYLNDKQCGGTTRIGLGRFNTKEEIDKLTEALSTL